jgi:hypothetical protein
MNYLIFVVAVVVATAVLLGLLWWYSTRPLYPEADAYAKKYCSDEQALARASEEAWQQARESEGRAMGDKLEPKEREEPKPLKAYLDWVNWRGTLEQRVAALEERLTALELSWDSQLGRDLRLRVAATPSPATASPTRDCPSDAAEQESIPPESLASSRSDQRIIVGGRVGRALKSADPPDVS